LREQPVDFCALYHVTRHDELTRRTLLRRFCVWVHYAADHVDA
jgi:hypothetical protein